MLTRILNSKLPLMVYNPTKIFSLTFFTEIFRSGALPVFDAEFMPESEIIHGAKQLEKEGILFGLRVVAPGDTLIDTLRELHLDYLDILIIPVEKENGGITFSGFGDTKLVLEVKDININDTIETLDPHALILKGNEAGGRVSSYSSFILMQWYLKNSNRPVFIHGGVGQNTASGMFAAGVSGVVLDSQLWLADESPVADNFKALLGNLDESDSIEVTTGPDFIIRVFAKLGTKIARELKEKAILWSDRDNARELLYRELEKELTALDDADASAIQSLFFLGQDALFAKSFKKISKSVKEIIPTFFKEIGKQLQCVDQFDPVVPDSPLAKEHGTSLPLIQGPMANISDNAEFASMVLKAGALPFMAVGSLPDFLAEPMLKKGAKEVKNFGAGLVGIEAFNPAIAKHMDMVKEYKVPFALFAGGIPSQIIELEKAGTKTYLHTPSVSMLKNAMENGCTRFIFEGKEAGGHVGSLSSLVLWDAAITRLLEDTKVDLSGISLIFAGGISTCFASWFISGMGAALAARGAKVGIQVGSAYLFTEEIIGTGAMKKRYQEILCKQDKTVVIGTSVGLASRTAPTEFARMTVELEKEMIKQGKPLTERKRAFEKNNIGSLLIGAKGYLPDFKRPGEEFYTRFDDAAQEEKGNFLVGDSLAYFNKTLTIPQVHGRYFNAKDTLYRNLGKLEVFSSPKNRLNDEIAIVGMGCILPGANDPEALWDNIMGKRYAIKEMPDDRIRKDLYYDADKSAEDKSYTMLAGLVEDYRFDQERFGYNDDKAAKLSKSQKILLEAAYQAVEDAGYLNDDLSFACEDPQRTAVIIATCLGNELGNELQLKYHFPEVVSMLRKLPEFAALTETEKTDLVEHLRVGMEGNNPGYDPVHGILLNIEASRVARHLGIRGPNYIVDAACASSFTALDAGVGELLSGDRDQVIVGGVNTHLAPESFIGFCKMGALSADGSFPFDERANGFILGEGAAVFVLKRMKDALRDGDTIHAVIKGIGSSSDGRGKSIAAPNVNGQLLALKRCFENMAPRVTPDDVSFVEAHGTSTIMGDQAELETLKQVYSTSKTGVSSVKSQIGHLLGGAGAAGLVKAVQAVKKGVLPPNANFERLSPNHDLKNSEIYIIESSEPWVEPDNKTRKAGVSSYGFGGINYHIVIEEFNNTYTPLGRDIFTDPSYDFNDDRIVIAGLGVRLPGAPDVNHFWDALKEGKKQLSSIPEATFDNAAYAELDQKSNYYLPMIQAGVIQDFKFNNIKYRMPPTTVRSLERGQLLGLDAADEAISSCGLDKLLSPGNKTGVILGTIAGERQNKNILRVRKELLGEIIENSGSEKGKNIARALVDAIRERIPENNEDTTPGLLSNIISGRIANHFGLNGANYVIDASCASAVMAINNATRSLAFKDLDFVLAGGVDANLYPVVLTAFKRLGLLSGTTARFFDDRADGYSMGEGAAVHVLTTRKKAKEAGMEILGEINHCTVKSSVPDHLLAPSEHTFVSTINECYKESGILKKELKHLDLFAFSNILGDMVEKQVAEKCFTHDLSCGNVKTQFGYFKAANPAVAMAKLILMNKNRTLLPFRFLDKEHTTLKNGTMLNPVEEITPVSPREPMRFAFNVNGIGGNHCHVIISPLPSMLQQKARAVAETSKIETPSSPVPVPAAAASGGPGATTPSRPATPPPVATRMKPAAGPAPFPTDGKHQKMVALLSGQGAQAPGMMKELYDSDPDIRNTMDRGEEIFVEQRGYSLLEMMFGEDNRLNLTENTQPAVFLSSAALFDRLHARGFEPDFFIGHSVGEYTALFCSGMLNFDDAMRLLLKRADLMKEAAEKHPGGIMVVFRNEKETGTFIRQSGIQDIYITNKNSENQTAVSGKNPAIDAFCEYLTSQNIIYKKLNLSAAFHTPLLQEAAEKLRDYLATITFNETNFGRVISNVTARPYPENRREVKDLLAKQITSPVEFIRSIEYVYESGRTHYIEIGPGRLLANLLKNINIVHFQSMVTVDRRQGEATSFETCKKYLASYSSIFTRQRDERQLILPKGATSAPATATPATAPVPVSLDDDFSAFKSRNNALAEKLLYEEFRRQKREAAMDALERFDFDTDSIVISGVSVGLPGKARRVFAQDNFDRILEGTNFIEPLSMEDKKRITDKNITRLFKQPDGNARFVEITRTEDVIQLAGQLGYFSLTDEYGIKAQYDVSMALAVAAGIEALKDAGIPLVMQYKEASSGEGKMIPNGFALPQEMQDDTGVIITSLWPSNETLLNEMERYLYDRFYLKPYEEFENIYFYLMENVKEMGVKEKITDWFFKIKGSKRENFGTYKFDRNFLMNACPLGSAHLAQIIRAKGPNTLLSSACASTTQAIGVAEDWIRVGRCKRVIVIGGENATSEAQNQWVGSGFLALGAATVKKRVSEAAKPFDSDRNGTIVGAGAVGLVIEKSDRVKARGMNGQAEILGTHMANSAYHTFNIDVPHMAREMTRFINRMEQQHRITKSEYAKKLLFMSHETYTPARGGSADAEVTALKTAFEEYLNHICISNTKGFTGHTLGAAIEDVVMVKALQKRKAPPIANLTSIPDHFKALNFSSKKAIQSEYGLHLAAGFGSHFAFLLIKRIEENTFDNNPEYTRWLQRVSGAVNPELKVIDNTLCVVPGPGGALPQSAPGEQPRLPKAMSMPEAASSASDISGEDKAPAAAIPEKATASMASESAAAPSEAAPAPAPSAGPGALDKIKEIIAEQTGYTTDMLEDTLDLEADLGIDTVKQVEIFAKAAGHFGFPVPEDLKLRDLNTIAKLADYINTKAAPQGPDTPPSGGTNAPGAAGGTSPAAVAPAAAPTGGGDASVAAGALEKVKEIIAEQTGYTTDMLEDTLDLEADLGIDTVKQVEIFAKAAGHFGFPVPEDLKLRDLNTIAKLADYINTKAAPQGPDTPPSGGTDAPGAAGGTSPAAVAPAAAPTGGATASVAAGALEKVKEIIAEQTGYTTDMLEDTLDLEADLGIDTVKQVEIFAKAAGHFGFPVPEDLKLRDLNTIAKLADYINTKAAPQEPDTPPSGDDGPSGATPGGSGGPSGDTKGASGPDRTDPATGTFGAKGVKTSDIKRLVPVIKAVPVPGTEAMDMAGKTVVMTLDNAGFAQKTAAFLGKKTRIIGVGADKNSGGFCDEFISMDLSSENAIKEGVAQIIQNRGEIHGFLHLAPLDLCFPEIAGAGLSGVDHVHAFFHLMKALFNELNKKDRFVAALSLESVVFPHDKTFKSRIEPCFAGISGMMKSLVKEMPHTRVKMVDFSCPDFSTAHDEIIGQFFQEITSGDTRVETGYRDGEKHIIKLDEQAPNDMEENLIKEGDTVVVTGGARGITFEILKQVVATRKTNLVILARSPIDTLDSKFLDPGATPATIMAGLRDSMPGAKPVALKNETDRIMAIRASRENLDVLRSQGVSVTYLACDVANRDAVEKALSGIDRVDGFIHAAGLEESMPFEKKAYDSFVRVFNTKVKGCRNVMAALEGKQVQYYIGFSSVTAKFGNEGQADYTAANDMLAKILFKAQTEQENITCKIMDWTAWSGAGMATRDTVKKVLTERGLKFLPLEEGIDFFMDELSDTVTTEVVITGLDEAFDRDGLLTVAPFLDKKTKTEEVKTVFSRHLSIERDRFLLDHAMEGTPIFLGATGVETMAEAAMASREKPGHLTRVSDFSIPYGIKLLQNRPKSILVSAEAVDNDPHAWNCTITSQFINPAGVAMGDPKLHYKARFMVMDMPLPGEKRSIPQFTPVGNSKELANQIYHPQRLFMDDLFRSIHDILSFDGKTLVSLLSYTSDAPFFNYGGEPEFLTDVVLLDGMFQTGGAFEFFTDSCVVLPYKIGTLEFMARGVKNTNYLCFTTRTASNDETDTYAMDLVDETGNFLMKLRDFEMVKLHKLTPEHTISKKIIEK
ncbi:malonyl CoA-acyl carrier protein transacylase [Desulfocicer vacuolatum DSM 3385]|uniref:Malonyl CoA-acyl carrier protein transacylase n=1 Tax=Desulfocicer vacuolatum DSM 3385 TaxID=1121400 RepID=A0A1W2BJ05_9BACT|nr:type I polyketide synthase [Desulfocicer vacuolatum]SMC72894.1 malonyl CoA-acyl carrier protein transacylase [Desulfocicer vacuolatum DSM 3385]